VRSHKSRKSSGREESALEAKRSPTHDPELVELFADDPGALAIADAIAATQRPPKRMSFARRRVSWVAIIAAVVVALLAALTRDTSRAGVIERAIAVVPKSRVVRLVLEDERPAQTIVNLNTGRRRLDHHLIEEWFDLRTGSRRVRDTIGGVAVSDVMAHGKNSETRIVGLDRFPAIYRAALVSAANREVRRTSVDSNGVYEIRFPHSRLLASVAIDAETYRPVRVVFHDGNASRGFRVVQLHSLPRHAKIPAPRPITGDVRGAVVAQSRKLDFAEASRVAPGRLLGMHLVAARGLTFRDGGTALEITFANRAFAGKLPSRYVRVQVSTLPYVQLGWRDDLVVLARGDKLVAEAVGTSWSGYFKRGRQLIHLMTSAGLAGLVQASKELRAG
jgi:hypothetical protein